MKKKTKVKNTTLQLQWRIPLQAYRPDDASHGTIYLYIKIIVTYKLVELVIHIATAFSCSFLYWDWMEERKSIVEIGKREDRERTEEN